MPLFLDSKTLEIFGQLLLAVVLGSAIGIDREIAHKSAGMRTHALVSMGSALFTLLPRYVAPGFLDFHIQAQIVTGIGFLGAGIIFFDNSKIKGLTTAAGVWVSAAIGMAVGLHLFKIAVIATLLTILVLVLLWPIERKFVKRFSRDDSVNSD